MRPRVPGRRSAQKCSTATLSVTKGEGLNRSLFAGYRLSVPGSKHGVLRRCRRVRELYRTSYSVSSYSDTTPISQCQGEIYA